MGYVWAQWILLGLNSIIILCTIFSLIANNKSDGSTRVIAIIMYILLVAAGMALMYFAGAYTHIFGPVGPMVVTH